MLRASIGTLVVLGLRTARMEAAPTTAYLMVGGKCANACAYCGQARDATGDRRRLSRMIWPEVSENELLQAFSLHPDAFRRICFQTTASSGVLTQLLSLIPQLRSITATPISVAYRVDKPDEAERLLDAGAERIGVAIDCCSEHLYGQIRGGSLAASVAEVKSLAARYPGRISTHLIIGLGETEMEAAELILELHHASVLVSLFAFTPVRGTRMEAHTPPALLTYRKLQLLLGLLAWEHDHLYVAYDAERRIHSFGLSEREIRSFLSEHFTFVTRGCPGCNRPFYTEAPGGVMFNYPEVPKASAQREIDSFLQGLKAEGFDLEEGKRGGGAVPGGVMRHYLGVEESLKQEENR